LGNWEACVGGVVCGYGVVILRGIVCATVVGDSCGDTVYRDFRPFGVWPCYWDGVVFRCAEVTCEDFADVWGSDLEGFQHRLLVPSDHKVATSCPPYGSQESLWRGYSSESVIEYVADGTGGWPSAFFEYVTIQHDNEARVGWSGPSDCRVSFTGCTGRVGGRLGGCHSFYFLRCVELFLYARYCSGERGEGAHDLSCGRGVAVCGCGLFAFQQV
jgi:hypothetical protein